MTAAPDVTAAWNEIVQTRVTARQIVQAGQHRRDQRDDVGRCAERREQGQADQPQLGERLELERMGVADGRRAAERDHAQEHRRDPARRVQTFVTT